MTKSDDDLGVIRRAAHGWVLPLLVGLGLTTIGCAGKAAPEATPCPTACQDGTALRAAREMIKLMFNLKLQGQPVGPQDESTDCPLGGSARVSGDATQKGTLGALDLNLTYTFDRCSYLQKDAAPERNYRLAVSGSVTEEGTLAVLSTATTALVLNSDALTLSGTVFDPPIEYQATACRLTATQDGNRVSGVLCGREAEFSF